MELNKENNLITVCSYNCKNFKSNTLMISKLIKNFNVCFFIEHWLSKEEEILFDKVANENNKKKIIYHSDYEIKDLLDKPGRPFGGLCMVIDKEYEVIESVIFNENIVKAELRCGQMNIVIIGVWMPYYSTSDKTKQLTYKSNVALLESELKTQKYVLIAGDWNSDPKRTNPIDKLFKKFLEKNQLINASESQINKTEFTYKNNETYAKIDHILLNSYSANNLIQSEVIIDYLDMSDHRPVSVAIKYEASEANEQRNETKLFHRFPWKDLIFKETYTKKFNKILLDSKDEFKFNGNPEELIDGNMKKLLKLHIKAARDAEKEISKVKKQQIKNQVTQQDRLIQAHVSSIERLNQQTNLANVFKKYKISEIKKLKNEIRKLQRHKLFEKQKTDALAIENMLQMNKNKFWNRIKSFRAKKIGSSHNISVEDFAKYYANLFSHEDRESNEKHRKIEEVVKNHYNEIQGENSDRIKFSEFEINDVITKLKSDKSAGNDFITNEMVKYGNSELLIKILKCIFNSMIKYGHTPDDFNISMVTPIPKKGENKTPSDFRPISVSTTYALIYETLLLEKSGIKKLIHNNQFGYKQHTSCKHAYFMVNETINYYKNGKSTIHLVSLDATKAFDKLWRHGLFYKLIDKIDTLVWRAIYEYYSKSKIILRIGDKKSNEFKTTEGVKQGGVLSPFLFNYFIDELIVNCLNAKCGATINQQEVGIIAYCDDVVVMSPTVSGLNKMLEECNTYAQNWKLKFNANKSAYLEIGNYNNNFKIVLGNEIVPKSKCIDYLGLPLGNEVDRVEYLENKMKKVEKAFYSLYSFGCKPNALGPYTIAYIYKQYCQSIFKYGLELIEMSKNLLNEYNVRQNILIKRSIGLSKYVKTKPLFNCLHIESIQQLYYKHKVFFIKQIYKNELTFNTFNYLLEYYKNTKINCKNSFIKQIFDLNILINVENCLDNLCDTIKKIESMFVVENKGLLDSIQFVIDCFSNNRNYIEMRKLLNILLNYEFYNIGINLINQNSDASENYIINN